MYTYNKKELSIRACVSYREKFLHLRQCHLLLDLCHHLLFLSRAHLVQGLLIHDVDLLAAADKVHKVRKGSLRASVTPEPTLFTTQRNLLSNIFRQPIKNKSFWFAMKIDIQRLSDVSDSSSIG